MAVALLCSCAARREPVQVGSATQAGAQATDTVSGQPEDARVAAEARPSEPEGLPELLHPLGDTPWLGVELKDLERGTAGVRVERVFRGSPAARSGLVRGDVLISIDGEVVREPQQVSSAVGRRGPGTRVGVLLERDGQQRLLAVELARSPDAEDLMRLHFVGLRAPELGALATVQGTGPWGWKQLEGKVVVVEFWARWCAVCRYMVPVLNQWHRRYRPQGLTLLGITGDPVAMADRTVRELGMSYPVVSDLNGKTSTAFAARQLPTLFVVDRRGIVRDVMVGLSEERLEDLEVLVEQLLAES